MPGLEQIILTIGIVSATISVIATVLSVFKSRSAGSSRITVSSAGKIQSFEIPTDQADILKRMLEIEQHAQQAAHPNRKSAAVR